MQRSDERTDQQVWSGFDEFVDARATALWRAAWLLTGDRQLAEDLVQEALSRCYRRFDELNRPGHSFEAYVRTAMHHQATSWWRRGRWRERPSVEVDSSSDDRTSSHDLARALASLSPKQRSVLALRYYDDLTEAQTAEILGISTGAVKQHAHRALAALRTSPLLDPTEGGRDD